MIVESKDSLRYPLITLLIHRLMAIGSPNVKMKLVYFIEQMRRFIVHHVVTRMALFLEVQYDCKISLTRSHKYFSNLGHLEGDFLLEQKPVFNFKVLFLGIRFVGLRVELEPWSQKRDEPATFDK